MSETQSNTEHEITEMQLALAELIFVGSQAKVLNKIARLVTNDPQAAFIELSETFPDGTIQPDLLGLEHSILFEIGTRLRTDQAEVPDDLCQCLAAVEKRLGTRLVKGGDHE